LQQQVIAIDVGAVGGAALERRRAVGVGARQQDDVDAIEHAGDAAGSELLRDDDERLRAGGLVAVLGGQDDDGRPTRRAAGAIAVPPTVPGGAGRVKASASIGAPSCDTPSGNDADSRSCARRSRRLAPGRAGSRRARRCW
jgi:hypothetical protein